MPRSKTAEQARAEHLQVLGPTLGPLYHALYNEVTWLHAKWQQYRILFGQSPERIALLNSVASFFFRVIEDALWDDMVLHLARLTDPPQSKKKDNLTLLRLTGAIQEPALSSEIGTLVGRAVTDSRFARDWRNRRLAHRDLALALHGQAEPLPGISRDSMERALAAVRAVLNRIEMEYFKSEVLFTHFLAHEDAETLVYYLKAAVDTETEQRERVRRKRVPPTDLNRESGV